MTVTGVVAAPETGADKASKAEIVYRTLRGQIVRLEREPGAFIDKGEVCEALGVSRFPVADALSRLAREGLVDVEPQRGSYVALLRLADMREAILMRTALESEAARLVAAVRDAALLREVDVTMDALSQAYGRGDVTAFFAADGAFHHAICRASSYPRLQAAIAAARAHMERLNILLSPQDARMRATLEQHGAIIAAMHAGDPEACATAMRRHLVSIADDIDALVARQPDYFRA